MDDRKRPAKELNDDDRQRPSKRERLQEEEERTTAAAAAAAPAAPAAATDEDDVPPPWTPDLHRAFVEAVFRIGIQRASPRAIEHYMHHSKELTAERTKSHLQKFRKNKEKSAREFMAEYDVFLAKRMAESRVLGATRLIRASTRLTGAQIAADITHTSLMHDFPSGPSLTNASSGAGMPQFVNIGMSTYGMHLPYPNLSDEESQSPIGVALFHVVEAVRSMTNHLQSIRRGGLAIAEPPATVASSDSYNEPRQQVHEDNLNASVNQQTSGPQDDNNAPVTNEDDMMNYYPCTTGSYLHPIGGSVCFPPIYSKKVQSLYRACCTASSAGACVL
eukprot:scaffold597_cov176-Amphora_coffeaeformis.AAC.2